MAIPRNLLEVMDKLEVTVVTRRPTLPDHVAWASVRRIWTERHKEGVVYAYKEGKYAIQWCEMSNEKHLAFLRGIDIDECDSTLFEEEIAHDEEELEKLLLKRLPNLDGLTTWRDSEIKYP